MKIRDMEKTRDNDESNYRKFEIYQKIKKLLEQELDKVDESAEYIGTKCDGDEGGYYSYTAQQSLINSFIVYIIDSINNHRDLYIPSDEFEYGIGKDQAYKTFAEFEKDLGSDRLRPWDQVEGKFIYSPEDNELGFVKLKNKKK